MTLDLDQIKRDRTAATQGPWVAAIERGCHGVIAQLLPEGGANFVGFVANSDAPDGKEDMRFANCRLMAAAPEMAAALEAQAAHIAELEAKLRGGAGDIASERERQQTKELWDAQHDDAYQDGELLDAGLCYAIMASALESEREMCPSGKPPEEWPWDDEWWKPCTPRRELVKAGALIAAEIDRMDRAAPQEDE